MSEFFDMAPTPFNNFMNTADGVVSQVPTLANSYILADSACTTGRAAMNFCCANNFVSRACFVASCFCGVMGAASSGTALIGGYFGIPATGAVGAFGARAFNRLGKYSLHVGNVTNGNFTNSSQILDLLD